MMWVAIFAMSRAVVFWSGSDRPLELWKLEPVRPSRLASSFIFTEKPSSLPEMPSARMMVASLPDGMMAPRSRSLTLIELFSAANMVAPPEGAPPRRQAYSETLNSVSGDSRPSVISRKITARLISLAMLPGALGVSAAFSNSTVPLSKSIRRACGAAISGCVCASAGSTKAARQKRTREARKTVRRVAVPPGMLWSGLIMRGMLNNPPPAQGRVSSRRGRRNAARRRRENQ